MAYTVDDLYRGDSLLGDPNDLDNLVEFGDGGNNSDGERQDGETGERDDGNDNEDGEDKDEDGSKKPAEKKIIRVKRPQPKLDAERLKGPRGLKELRKSFADIKFAGKGHEAQDLQRVMARLEHWSHRLFPKFQFDDFLEKMEKLGSKKVVQNYVKRLRMGLEDEDDDVNRRLDEEAADDPLPAVADEAMSEFDRLLDEQVSLHETSRLSAPTPSPRNPGTQPQSRLQTATSTPAPQAPQALTPDQRARIEANRRAAMEKRRTRAALRASGANSPPPPPPPPAPGSAPASARSPGCLRGRRSSVSSTASDTAEAQDAVEADVAVVADGVIAAAVAGVGVIAAAAGAAGIDVAASEAGVIRAVADAEAGMQKAAADAAQGGDVMEASSSSTQQQQLQMELQLQAVELPVDIADVEVRPLAATKSSDTQVEEMPVAQPRSVSNLVASDLCLSDNSSSCSSGDVTVTINSKGKRASDVGEPPAKRRVDPDPPSPARDTTSWNLASFMSPRPQRVQDHDPCEPDAADVVDLVSKGENN